MPSVIKTEVANALYHFHQSKGGPDESAQLLEALDKAEKAGRFHTEQEVAEVVADLFNKIGFNGKKFSEGMSRQHRTLQQTFTGVCFEWIIELASPEHGHDLRNQASVEKAESIVQHFENIGEYFGRLPCI